MEIKVLYQNEGVNKSYDQEFNNNKDELEYIIKNAISNGFNLQKDNYLLLENGCAYLITSVWFGNIVIYHVND